MKLNKIIVEKEFEDLFSFENEFQELEHHASMIMFRFLSEIEKVSENQFSRKNLSELIGTSASYITQLFRGDKLINMSTLAKFEKALDITFEIKAIGNSTP